MFTIVVTSMRLRSLPGPDPRESIVLSAEHVARSGSEPLRCRLGVPDEYHVSAETTNVSGSATTLSALPAAAQRSGR